MPGYRDIITDHAEQENRSCLSCFAGIGRLGHQFYSGPAYIAYRIGIDFYFVPSSLTI
jgi:hypothetical protein